MSLFRFRRRRVRRTLKPESSKLRDGEQVNFNGKEYKIIFSDKKFLKPRVFESGNTLTVFKSEFEEKSHRQILLEWLKKESKKIITKRTTELAKIHNYNFNKIAIRDQSTRWGSCSSDKNLNFSWRLALSPNEVMDYVIIHEIAHLKEMNHSKNFWRLVQGMMPEYKRPYKWLKDKGHELKMY